MISLRLSGGFEQVCFLNCLSCYLNDVIRLLQETPRPQVMLQPVFQPRSTEGKQVCVVQAVLYACFFGRDR